MRARCSACGSSVCVLEHINDLIDDTVTDVFVNASTGVWLQRDHHRARADLACTESEVRELAVELVELGGRHIDDASPCVDVRLGGGVRVHAVLAPVSVGGTEVSIRLPRASTLTLNSWMTDGTLTESQVGEFRRLVQQRATFLVSGATGAGKTSFLAALMSEVTHDQRIVTIEDVAELAIAHPRCVRLEARQNNTDGRGEISIAELVRQALRMRPDRLVVGECRGVEVVDMLRAFTTGHSGGGSTIHASSLSDVAIRLDSLAALAGMMPDAMARLAVSAIDVVVHIDHDEGVRRLACARLINDDGILRAVTIAF